jgi:hypothetical protein
MVGGYSTDTALVIIDSHTRENYASSMKVEEAADMLEYQVIP